MKNARPANLYSHRAHRCAQAMTPTKSISPNSDDEKGKSQSILNLETENERTESNALIKEIETKIKYLDVERLRRVDWYIDRIYRVKDFS